ncbi:uncharacterized protein LOC135401323 isoform X2 [Ornithodoros turicata]|uniref:uncharacterized protein LOC135401323 isoform X2 n=1 Tax=Ornithodoros turicata TaxID=34597 RepID=UPI003139ADC9
MRWPIAQEQGRQAIAWWTREDGRSVIVIVHIATPNNMADVSCNVGLPSSINMSTDEIRMEFPSSNQVENGKTSVPDMFAEVPLCTLENGLKKKTPRRILHFSDGILEEYSSEEDELVDANLNRSIVDPRTLTWFPYIIHLALQVGTKTLAVCDYLGENLAYFFGITSPKYQYELEEYNRMVQEEMEEKKKVAEQMAGWKANDDSELGQVTVQPFSTPVSNSPEVASMTADTSSLSKSSSSVAAPDSTQWERTQSCTDNA